MRKPILDRYKKNDHGQVIIEIATEKIEDLYHNFDKTAPYFRKDLDQNIVDYLVDSVSEIGKEDFLIQFLFSASRDENLLNRIQRSISNYFLYQIELEVREMKRMLRTSLILLSLGILFITLSIFVNAELHGSTAVIKKVFAEGLTVAAWVSLWESLATFLINWAPHRRQIKLFKRISKAQVLFP